MDRDQTRLGLLGITAAILLIAGIDLVTSQPSLAGNDFALLAVGAIPVVALATAYLLPDPH